MSLSQPGEVPVPGTKTRKGDRESIMAKLTSQQCVRSTKGKEECNNSGGSKRASGVTEDMDIRTMMGSSAEVLQNMRRDSGDTGDSGTSVVKYGKGDSMGDESEGKGEPGVLKIRPDLAAKFRPGLINQIIEATIKEHLADKEYSASEAQSWTKTITEAIQRKTKEQNFARYKLVACVVLGERRGQGLSSAYRCLWDSESDCAASYTFMNDSLYCIGMVFGVYFY